MMVLQRQTGLLPRSMLKSEPLKPERQKVASFKLMFEGITLAVLGE